MHVWLRHHPREIWGRWRGVLVKKVFIIKASKKQTIYKPKKTTTTARKKRKQKKSKTNKQPTITKNKQTRKFSEEDSTIKR